MKAQLPLLVAAPADAWADAIAVALADVAEVRAVAVVPGDVPCVYVAVVGRDHMRVARLTSGARVRRAAPPGGALRIGSRVPDGARVVWRAA